jgi:hypothetical protein
LVKVFIRTFDKKAKCIKFPSKIPGLELKELIAEKLHIPVDKLVLFNHGQ